MTMKILTGAVSAAMNELYKKSMNDKYYDDPVLWAEEVLGVHLWSKQREIAYSLRDNKRTAVRSSNGVGKGLAITTPIRTINGWTTMGALRVGDYVWGANNKPTKVTFKSEVHNLECFRVTFGNGDAVVCDIDHLWELEMYGTLGMREVLTLPLPVFLTQKEHVIVSIVPVKSEPTQCIQVSAADSLYRAGRSEFITHNTMVCGVLASWWIATRYPNDPQQTVVVVTAPAFPQIKTNLFHELNVEMTRSKEKTYSNGEPKGTAFQPLPGHISTSGNIAQWLSPEGAQLAIGRKPADGDVIRTFAGIHRKNILFIIDEAGGVSPDMFVSAERLTTNAGAKILIVGNPDRRGSEFFKTFDEDSDWNKIRISAFDTPTHTGEPCPEELLEYMPSPEWVQRNIKAWGGPEDPRVQIAIYGNFPDSDDSVFFPERIINQAQDTEIDPLLDATATLGVDLAMQGKDESRIYLNKGGRIRLVKSWPGESARKNAETIIEAIIETEADIVNIDSGGIGTPIIERMLELVQERDDVPPFRLTRMNSSEVSPDPRRWYNMRAYWYDMLRTGIIEGKVDLDIDRKIKGQLTDIGFSIWDTGTRAGSIIMESKKDMRSRVGYSPDDIDAIVYSFFNPDTMLEEKTPKKSYTDPIDILGGEDFLPNYFTAMESVYGLSI